MHLNFIKHHWLPVLAYCAMLLWAWRIYDLANSVANYADTLEVLWGIETFYNSLLRNGLWPRFDTRTYAPVGLLIGSMGWQPLPFVLMALVRAIGTPALALNLFLIAGYAVAFAGTYVLLRRWLALSRKTGAVGREFDAEGAFAPTVGALVYTFAPFLWDRVHGHPNVLLNVGLLPWLLLCLINLNNANDAHAGKARMRWAVRAGLVWALQMHCQLYALFLSGLPVMVFGVWLGLMGQRRTGWKPLALLCIIALLCTAPLFALYVVESRNANIVGEDVAGLAQWGASLNSLFIPSVQHPIPFLRQWATRAYTGIQNETGVANWGIVLPLLAMVAVWRAARPRPKVLLVLGIGAFLLALGPLLKWDGHPVQTPLFSWLNGALWQLGHALKPTLFGAFAPPDALANSVPLPGLLLAAVLPFWESARVSARFAFVLGLVLVVLACTLLPKLPKFWQVLMGLLLLIEVLPPPANRPLPVPKRTHPAYDWVKTRNVENSALLAISDEPTVVPLALNGALYAAQLHGMPSVAGYNGPLPKHIHTLNEKLRSADWANDWRSAMLLRAYGVRFVMLHHIFNKSDVQWQRMINSPYLIAQNCFEPHTAAGVWSERVCVAELKPMDAPVALRIAPHEGWSPPESWGMWAIAPKASAEWLATDYAAVDYTLRLKAVPSCVAGKQQSLIARVNGHVVGRHTWHDCNEAALQWVLPRAAFRLGLNQAEFEFAYAAQPTNANANVSDTRTLAVGFAEIVFQPQPQ